MVSCPDGPAMALGLQVLPFFARHALELPDLRDSDGVLREQARSRGDRAQPLSLADMCCLATGIIEKLTVVTGDTYWWELPLPALALIDYRAP